MRLRVPRVCLEQEEAAILVLLPFPDVPGNPRALRWWDAGHDAVRLDAQRRLDAQIAVARQERRNRPARAAGAGKLAVRVQPPPAVFLPAQRSAVPAAAGLAAARGIPDAVQFAA